MAGPAHTYAVPAYGTSPHLEACLASLQAQRVESAIVVSTSTPTDAVRATTRRLGVRLHEHGPNRGIGPDWNAALRMAETPLVTLAHQDDIYRPGHAESVTGAFANSPRAVMAFTGYRELQGEALRPGNRTLLIKCLQRELGFFGRRAIAAPALKRMTLRFGNSIPCPAVTISLQAVPEFRFREDMRTNMDWDAWLQLASSPGEFLYLRDVLVLHRIHAGSETTACISDGFRAREDLEMFSSMWPSPVARVLARLYAGSYATNG